MAGSSIFEYVHPKDHTELAEHLGMCVVSVGSSGSSPGSGSDDGSSPGTPRPSSPSSKNYMMVKKPDQGNHKSFSLRMKSTLTKRGVQVKSSGYRVVHILGTFRSQSSYGSCMSETIIGEGGKNRGGKSSGSEPPLLGMVGMAIALPPPTITELRLEQDTFITRLSPDFKVIFCEPIISDLMELTVDDVTDRLLYDLCHVADLKSLKKSHEDILNKGQALTDYYRLLNRNGGYVWIQTCATTLLNNKNAEDQTILAINYVVSGVENKGAAFDLWQLTGDVTSSMSSATNSRFREDKLKELKTSGLPNLNINRHGLSNTSPMVISSKVTKSDDDTLVTEKTTHLDRSPKARPDTPADDTGHRSSPGGKTSGDLLPDSKTTKRRKNENPRKRRRTNSGGPAELGEKTLVNGGAVAAAAHVDDLLKSNGLLAGQAGDTIAFDRLRSMIFPLHPDHVTSSSPEDLSMKKTTNALADRRVIQHSSNVAQGRNSPARKRKSAGQQKLDKLSTSPIAMTGGNSVLELEAAMNRHLPVVPTTTGVTDTPIPGESHPYKSAVNAQTNMSKSYQGPNPGVCPTNTPSANDPWLSSHQKPPGASDVLTASNFLRSLYANRESVIKTSPRSQVPFLSPDPPTSLLTPPEPDPATYKDSNNLYSYPSKSESSSSSSHAQAYDKDNGFDPRDHFYRDQTPVKDQFSFIPYKDHLSSSYIDHISSSVYKDHLASPYKDHLASPYKDLPSYREIIPAFTIPSLMSPGGRMHHQTYSSLPPHFTVPISTAAMDACSITPPSSNSPEVGKGQPHHQTPFDVPGYPTEMTSTCDLSQKQPAGHAAMPPLTSSTSPGHNNHSYHPHHHHHHQHHAATHLQKDQLFQNGGDLARGGYYGVPGPTPGSMYMDLNQATSVNGQYDTCSRPIIPWY
ncbi:hypothetical protein Btru_023764 [Bulinus truncatus]|nr:hypothetical protein Btru_023764 [Bulinus truncatus]